MPSRRKMLTVIGALPCISMAGCSSLTKSSTDVNSSETESETVGQMFAPQFTVQCESDGDRVTIEHSGGDILKNERAGLANVGDEASLVPPENGEEYVAGDTIAAGPPEDITEDAEILWKPPDGGEDVHVARCEYISSASG